MHVIALFLAAADLTEAAVFIRQQRVALLRTIKAQSPQGVRGGRENGLTEVLLDFRDEGQAKLLWITPVMGSRSAVRAVRKKTRVISRCRGLSLAGQE
ncbi:hypothetical protein V474_01915 [Novosphingobium barchaimii LL02]|uniref:Uncharacterized protein n=1 Tax=Novosphingobium barchaimii LL02 TaxID=1114963 RepID=A0A0J7XL36_9SPHN|nr:hypothetical protein [Novosphingobium barchaimii]KMS51818.1 hypothetical protein V474_01915 [Novosphingobium barchaimii LL02]